MKKRAMNAEKIATALGWFSIGLGVTELITGGRMSKAFGMGDRNAGKVVRAFGVREIASGVAILAGQKKLGVWSRVPGDLADLGTLWSALALPSNPHRGRVALAMGAVAGTTALDVATARRL
jgi:hypothetical protein